MDHAVVFHRPFRISLDSLQVFIATDGTHINLYNYNKGGTRIKDGFQFLSDIKTFVLSLFVLHVFIQSLSCRTVITKRDLLSSHRSEQDHLHKTSLTTQTQKSLDNTYG